MRTHYEKLPLALVGACVLLSGCTTLEVHRRTVTTDPDGKQHITDNTGSYTAPDLNGLEQAWSIASPIISAGLGALPGGSALTAIIGSLTTAGAGAWALKRGGDAKAARDSRSAADAAYDEATARTHALYAAPPASVVTVGNSGGGISVRAVSETAGSTPG